MKALTILVLLLLAGGVAIAQSPASGGGQQTSNLSLTDAIDISLVSVATTTLTFANVNDYANGIESEEQTMVIRSNKKFNVRVKTSSSKFTYSGPSANPNMNVTNVLKVKVTANNTGGTLGSGFSNYKNMSTSGAKIINAGTPGGNNTFSIKYMATPGFAYPAGTYTVNIIYTATQA